MATWIDRIIERFYGNRPPQIPRGDDETHFYDTIAHPIGQLKFKVCDHYDVEEGERICAAGNANFGVDNNCPDGLYTACDEYKKDALCIDALRELLYPDTADADSLDKMLAQLGLQRWSRETNNYVLRIRQFNAMLTKRRMGCRIGVKEELGNISGITPYIERTKDGAWAWVLGDSGCALGIGEETPLLGVRDLLYWFWRETICGNFGRTIIDDFESGIDRYTEQGGIWTVADESGDGVLDGVADAGSAPSYLHDTTEAGGDVTFELDMKAVSLPAAIGTLDDYVFGFGFFAEDALPADFAEFVAVLFAFDGADYYVSLQKHEGAGWTNLSGWQGLPFDVSSWFKTIIHYAAESDAVTVWCNGVKYINAVSLGGFADEGHVLYVMNDSVQARYDDAATLTCYAENANWLVSCFDGTYEACDEFYVQADDDAAEWAGRVTQYYNRFAFNTSDKFVCDREEHDFSAGTFDSNRLDVTTVSGCIIVKDGGLDAGERYLLYDAETAPFNVGATLTGGTSGATAEIVAATDWGSEGVLTLGNITGAFEDDEAITDDGGAPGSATVNGTAGNNYLAYDNEAGGPFTVTEEIEGVDSDVVGILRGVQDDGATGKMVIETYAGLYEDDEHITGGASGATADVDGESTSLATCKFLSQVIDLGADWESFIWFSDWVWHRKEWQFNNPERDHTATLKVEMRSGSAAVPDVTWTSWAEIAIDQMYDPTLPDVERYIQYRLTIRAHEWEGENQKDFAFSQFTMKALTPDEAAYIS